MQTSTHGRGLATLDLAFLQLVQATGVTVSGTFLLLPAKLLTDDAPSCDMKDSEAVEIGIDGKIFGNLEQLTAANITGS